MFKKLLPILLLASFVSAESLMYQIVQPVTQQDGDTIITSQVSIGVCPGTSCPTLLSAPIAITNTSGTQVTRKRVFVNTGGFNVFIGTNTTNLATGGFVMAPSSTTYYTTFNTASFYATATTTSTVSVITEYNSVP